MNLEEKCRTLLRLDKFDECKRLIEEEMARTPDSPIPQNLQKNSRKASTFQGGGCKAEK